MLVLMTEVGMVVMKVAVCPIPAYFQTWYRLSSSKTDQKKKKKGASRQEEIGNFLTAEREEII